MAALAGSTAHARFADFVVDFRSGELRRHGLRVRLGERPLQILATLLEHPGQVVTREELQHRLWPADTFVDFEHSINTAVNKLREALGDSAEHPRFIETLPRHGYRFIAPVDVGRIHELPAPAIAARAIPESPLRRHRHAALVAGIIVATLAVLAALDLAGVRDRVLRSLGAVREPPLQIQSIAVLPLENLSGDPGQDSFADAMTEELITNLGKSSGLRVISRTSVMRYKGAKKPMPEIAKELNVDAVVEGTVHRFGDRVRITANLLHVPTDRHLWAETYDRDLKDALAVGSDVTGAIAYSIRTTLSPHQDVHPATRPRPVNPEAYEAYLKGRYYTQRFTIEGLNKSSECFAKAIEADPNYGPAYAGIADNCMWASRTLRLPRAEYYAKGRAAARRALELDPTLAEAHAALAGQALFFEWDWATAEKEFQRAIQLNPNLVVAREGYAEFLMLMGRSGESIAERKRALQLDPLSLALNTQLAWSYGNAHRFDEAIRQLQQVLEMEPNFVVARFSLGEAYELAGRHEEAVRELHAALAANKGDIVFLGYLGYTYGRAHQPRKALEVLAEMQKRAKKENVSRVLLGVVYLGLSQPDKALTFFEDAYKQRDVWLIAVIASPEFDPLRSDPRFQALLRRMNLPS